MARVDFMAMMHQRTRRDYRGRILAHDKAACATVAKQWGHDYWDGSRQFGYGGYRYDGRWLPFAGILVALVRASRRTRTPLAMKLGGEAAGPEAVRLHEVELQYRMHRAGFQGVRIRREANASNPEHSVGVLLAMGVSRALN